MASRMRVSGTACVCRAFVSFWVLIRRVGKIAMHVEFSIMVAAIAPANASEHAVDSKQQSAAGETTGIRYIPISDDKKEVHQVVAKDVVQSGRELRIKLEETYKKLVDTNGLRLLETDVTYAVLPSIPVGTSFSEAEAILRNAGFVVEPHPTPNSLPDPNKPKDWYAVLASIAPFHKKFPFITDLYVMLYPDSPGDYKSVTKISATFLTSGP